MDGNGRWAGRRGLPRTDGHTEGEENLARLVRVAVQRDIGWLTVFGFSTENWRRPRPEVRHILGLHEKLFGRVAELNELNLLGAIRLGGGEGEGEEEACWARSSSCSSSVMSSPA